LIKTDYFYQKSKDIDFIYQKEYIMTVKVVYSFIW